jgi:type VI protein secretion system component VasF
MSDKETGKEADRKMKEKEKEMMEEKKIRQRANRLAALETELHCSIGAMRRACQKARELNMPEELTEELERALRFLDASACEVLEDILSYQAEMRGEEDAWQGEEEEDSPAHTQKAKKKK